MTTPNYINHIALVLDASASMSQLASKVVQVADEQIQHLAQRSKELDQETRITVYTFSSGPSSHIRCLFYDKDVLRLPSLRGLYQVGGMTALIDATFKALDDLDKTPELYGDHAFLAYVLTDGRENASLKRPRDLTTRLTTLKDNWTVAAFVPDRIGVREAEMYCGFPSNNISVWEASEVGTQFMGETMTQATDYYMNSRSKGIRSVSNLFRPDTEMLKPIIVHSAGLRRLLPGQFRMSTIMSDIPIASAVEHMTGRPYVLGEGFYQLTKPVVVQPQKKVALYEKGKHTVYVGTEARTILGLPDYEVKVAPASHPNYDIFVQSTSVNRKLLAGTKLLVVSQGVA